MLKVTKHGRKYEIIKAAPFGTWGELKDRRMKLYGEKGMTGMYGCFLCNKEFSDTDRINLCFVKGYKNRLVCNECAERIENAREGSVEE